MRVESRILFVRVCSTSELDDGSMNRFEAGKISLLVARAGDSFFATEATCTHEEADLSLGILSGHVLTCPLHQAQFDIRSGEVLGGPDGTESATIRQLGTYQTKVENNEVLVDL